jgi:transcriptional regulator with XRE-family HTH domain
VLVVTSFASGSILAPGTPRETRVAESGVGQARFTSSLELESLTLIAGAPAILGFRSERQALGFSQEQLAEAAGLSRNYYGSVERGEKMPSALTVLQIAEAMNLTGAAADAAAEETVSAYVNMRAVEYHTYWKYRLADPNPNDSDFTVDLSPEEEALYKLQLGWGDAQIAALEAKRSDEYQTLHGVYAVVGDTYEESWTYRPPTPPLPIQVVNFQSLAGVDDLANTVTISSHSLVTGQAVSYSSFGGAAVIRLDPVHQSTGH